MRWDMRLLSSTTLAVLAAAVLAATPITAQTTAPSTAPAEIVIPTAPSNTPDNLSEALRNIEQAPDPSAAIDAYAKGVAIDTNGLAVESAFLRKMVSFDLPEMAEAQARDLTRRDPLNGLAWGVQAHVSGRRGDMAAALGEVQVAARRSPDDPFVQRTAARLLAWYDTQPDLAKDVPATVRDGVTP